MFRYELKKIFGKKKLVILGAFYILLMFYCLFLMVGSKEFPRDGGEVLLQFTGGFDYFILVNVCIVIVTVAALFPLERETGLSQVLLASKYGKNRLAMVKIGAALFLANAFFAVIVLVLILGYVAVFGRDFGVPIAQAGAFGLEYAIDPGIGTYGDLLFMMMAGVFLSMNFTVLFTMSLSIKFRRALPAAASVIFLYFAGTFLPEIPVLGFVFNLSPICLGMRAVTYKVLFSIGSLSVTVLHVGMAVYLLLIGALFARVKSAYSKNPLRH